MFPTLPTPHLLLDRSRLQRNIAAMQSECDKHGVELRPHIKTHKMTRIAALQLRAGAAGLTCAKLGEAEAMLPAFQSSREWDSPSPRSMFLAHSLVDASQAPRLRALRRSLDELVVACTSQAHLPHLQKVLEAADLILPVMMAVDSGLGREGTRDLDGAMRLARLILEQPNLRLHGIYSHEGHLYGVAPEEIPATIAQVHRALAETKLALQSTLSIELKLWPGCSVSAAMMASLPHVDAVRPGAYVFGDLNLAERAQTMNWEQIALTILATVVDRPAPDLALIDAGSKVFSGDKLPCGISARDFNRRDLSVTQVSEEHGFVRGRDVSSLRVGERLRLVPAHVCPVMNLADEAIIVEGDSVADCWPIEARGRVR